MASTHFKAVVSCVVCGKVLGQVAGVPAGETFSVASHVATKPSAQCAGHVKNANLNFAWTPDEDASLRAAHLASTMPLQNAAPSAAIAAAAPPDPPPIPHSAGAEMKGPDADAIPPNVLGPALAKDPDLDDPESLAAAVYSATGAPPPNGAANPTEH